MLKQKQSTLFFQISWQTNYHGIQPLCWHFGFELLQKLWKTKQNIFMATVALIAVSVTIKTKHSKDVPNVEDKKHGKNDGDYP